MSPASSFPPSVTELRLDFEHVQCLQWWNPFSEKKDLPFINLENCRNLKILTLGNCLKIELAPNLRLEQLNIHWEKIPEDSDKSLFDLLQKIITKQINLDFEKLEKGPEYVRQYLQGLWKEKKQPE